MVVYGRSQSLISSILTAAWFLLRSDLLIDVALLHAVMSHGGNGLPPGAWDSHVHVVDEVHFYPSVNAVL